MHPVFGRLTAAALLTSPALAQPTPPDPNPAFTWRDVAHDPQLIGLWHLSTTKDGRVTTASFGGGAGDASFVLECERGRGITLARTFSRALDIAAGEITALNILTPDDRHIFVAHAAVDGAPRVIAQVARRDPRLDAFAASEEGFAVQTAGDTTRIRHDPMLARVIAACREINLP